MDLNTISTCLGNQTSHWTITKNEETGVSRYRLTGKELDPFYFEAIDFAEENMFVSLPLVNMIQVATTKIGEANVLGEDDRTELARRVQQLVLEKKNLGLIGQGYNFYFEVLQDQDKLNFTAHLYTRIGSELLFGREFR